MLNNRLCHHFVPEIRAFWSISLEPDFSQIKDLFRDIANNINFHLYRTNSQKINNRAFF